MYLTINFKELGCGIVLYLKKSRHPEQVYNTPRQSIHAMQGENTD